MNILGDLHSPVVAGSTLLGVSFGSTRPASPVQLDTNTGKRLDHALESALLFCLPMVCGLLLARQLLHGVNLPADLLVPYGIFFLLPALILAAFGERFRTSHSAWLMKLCVLLAGLDSGVVMKLLMQ